MANSRRPLRTKTCVACLREFQTRKNKTRFCSKSCIWKATKGPEFNARISRATAEQRAARQRGTGSRGYIKQGGRHQHRVVAEQMLGRPLKRGEVVHHKDGNKHNNDPSNLEVMTQGEHMREHGIGIPWKPLHWKPWEKSGHVLAKKKAVSGGTA